MALDSVEQLFERIDVLYFRPGEPDSELQLAKYSVVPPSGLEAYASGYNLVSIRSEFESWSSEDQHAFLEFLNSERVDRFLESLLEAVDEYKNRLSDNPQVLQGMLALWWKLGIHPLQQDEREDG